MTLELLWYPTEKDRQADQNECPVSLISVSSYTESQLDDGPIHQWCDNDPTRYECETTLVELVAEESLYGQWLRQQANLGYQSLAGKTELITPMKIWLIFGRPQRSTILSMA